MNNKKENMINYSTKQLISHYGYEKYANDIIKLAHYDLKSNLGVILHFKHSELTLLIQLLKFLDNEKTKDIVISSNTKKLQLDHFAVRTLRCLLENYILEEVDYKPNGAFSLREEIQQEFKIEDIDMDEIFIYCNRRNWDFELSDEVFLKSIQKFFIDIGMLKVNNEYRLGINKEYAFINDMYEIMKGDYNIDWSTPFKEKADKVKYLIEKDIHKGRYMFMYIDFFGKNTR